MAQLPKSVHQICSLLELMAYGIDRKTPTPLAFARPYNGPFFQSGCNGPADTCKFCHSSPDVIHSRLPRGRFRRRAVHRFSKQPRRRTARQLPVGVVSDDLVPPVDFGMTCHPVNRAVDSEWLPLLCQEPPAPAGL